MTAPPPVAVSPEPPPSDDDEEEVEFVTTFSAADLQAPDDTPPEVANDVHPPAEDEAVGAHLVDDFDEEAPFDPPDSVDEALGRCPLAASSGADHPEVDDAPSAPALETPRQRAGALLPGPAADPFIGGLPVPPIAIHVSWDRPEIADLLAGLGKDPRLARAEFSIERGGLDGAIARYQHEAAPDLLIVDTTLRGPQILDRANALAPVIAQGAKVIVLGAVNDVMMFRDLAARGVSEYVMDPVAHDQLAQTICALFTEANKSHVIAVVGARGGVGASTIARNIAWSIAERQKAGALLIDLDVSFGASASECHIKPAPALAEALLGSPDDSQLEQLAVERGEHLKLLTAAGDLKQAVELNPQALTALLDSARRMAPYVVLDLPHVWNVWVKQALLGADDIVLVAGPDLASLRNGDNIVKLLQAEGKDVNPLVALSMAGVPRRPEIPLREFAEALGIQPSASFAFDPALFAGAALTGQMIGEAAPRSKAAQLIDTLATKLTGREPQSEKPARKLVLPASAVVSAAEPASVPEEPSELDNSPAAEVLIAPEDEPSRSEDGLPDAPRATETAIPVTEEPAQSTSRLAETPIILREHEPPSSPAPAPLQLDVLAPDDDYFERARRAAESELDALQAKPRSAFGLRSIARLAGVAVACAALGAGGTWYIANRSEAAAPQLALPAPAEAAAHVRLEAPQAPDAAALYRQALDASDAAEAVDLLQQAADAGHALAQHRLAKHYERGEGVAVDADLARQWTERAAASGNVPAMHDLGVYYALGEAGPIDEHTAFRWFRQAAEFNNPDSQFNLGILYQQGRGVSADAEEALFWFLLAARQGDEAADTLAIELEAELTMEQVERANARAQAFSPRIPPEAANEAGAL